MRVILNISPELLFINFEIIRSVSEGDYDIDKNNAGDISQISRTAIWFYINHIFTDKHHIKTSTTSNKQGDYKTEGDYKTADDNNKQLTSPVRSHKEIWFLL